mgnify:CR=1 FL=1
MTLLWLTIGYVVIAALLLNVGFRSHWHWVVKLSAVLVTTVFYFANWYGLQQLQGWPVDKRVPAEFHLLSEYIVHPDKQEGTEGAIYLWVIDRSEGANNRPRAYKLPYREKLHEDIAEARASGKPQIGRRVEQGTEGQDRQSADAAGSGIEFEDVPRPNLPPKQ